MKIEFDAEDEAFIQDIMPIIRKHGLEAGYTTRQTAEFIVVALEAQARVEIAKMVEMVQEGQSGAACDGRN